jgi:hypothetical protein
MLVSSGIKSGIKCKCIMHNAIHNINTMPVLGMLAIAIRKNHSPRSAGAGPDTTKLCQCVPVTLAIAETKHKTKQTQTITSSPTTDKPSTSECLFSIAPTPPPHTGVFQHRGTTMCRCQSMWLRSAIARSPRRHDSQSPRSATQSSRTRSTRHQTISSSRLARSSHATMRQSA